MKKVVLLWCFTSAVLIVQANKLDKKSSKRDDIFSENDLADIHDVFKQNTHQTDDEVKAAFPVMDAFKSHPLLSSDDLKDKAEYDFGDQDSIEKAVKEALVKLHKKKNDYEQEINKHTSEHHNKPSPIKPHITAKQVIDEVVRQEMEKHKQPQQKDHYETETAKDSAPASRSNLDYKIHTKLTEISELEEKLYHLIRDVKGYLLEKKRDLPQHAGSGSLEDDDNVDNILLNKKKRRSSIPHIQSLEKFRKDHSLVDKYMDSILKEDYDTAQGDQRDLLGKKEMETALLRQAVPGEIDSIPLSRLEKESEENESIATDRGIARDALVESPFSVLDVKQTTGKKFRHTIS